MPDPNHNDSQKAHVKHLASKLELLRGKLLTRATYYPLRCDVDAGFAPERRNKYGSQAVGLGFGAETIFFSWDTNRTPTKIGIAYRIETFEDLTQFFRSKPPSFDASQTDIWYPCVGRTLASFEFYGAEGAPLAVLMKFGGTEVVVALGHTGDSLSVSDGDDVLTLATDEFLKLTKSSDRLYKKIKL
jgi:hypothetical protein